MDRRLSYIDANPDILDLLLNSRFALEAVAKLGEAVLGSTPSVDGFACTPTSPASLTVNVGAGQIYQMAALEGAPISSLNQDTHQVLKQGLLRDALALTLTPPSTPGYAQNVLIQVQYADDDASTQQVYNYYNAANPDVPLTGPGGNNQAQTAVRKGVASVATKYGVPASAGSQSTPAPDAGWSGLFVVTLAYGQSAITVGNIVQYAGAPFIGTKLPQIPAYVRSGQVQRVVTNATYFIRTDGNDSNDGLTNTATGAFQTLAGALAATSNILTTNGVITYQLGVPGTYAAPPPIARPGGNLRIVGDPAAQQNYVISGAGSSSGSGVVAPNTVYGATIAYSGVTLANTGTVADTLNASGGAQITVDRVTFTAAAGNNFYAMAAYGTGSIVIGAGVFIASSQGGWLLAAGGRVTFGSGITISFNNPTWSFAGVYAYAGGYISQFGSAAIFSGGSNGPRYYVTTNGILQTNGAGPNYYPGSSAGTADTANGGRYV